MCFHVLIASFSFCRSQQALQKADERMVCASEKPRARGNHFKADRREYGDVAVSSPPSGVVNWAIRTPVTTNTSSEVSITPVLSASQTPLHVQDHHGSLYKNNSLVLGL